MAGDDPLWPAVDPPMHKRLSVCAVVRFEILKLIFFSCNLTTLTYLYTLMSYLKSITMLLQRSSFLPVLFLRETVLIVCLHVFVCLLPFCCSLTYRFSHYYFACAIGGEHDGHIPFWLPAFVKLIFRYIACFAC